VPHGWSYHPTKIGKKHPHLKFDLLAAQIDACREIGVRCPIYLSAGLDELAAFANPTWVVKKKDGTTYKPLEVEWFVRILRFNSPYLDYLCAQIREWSSAGRTTTAFFWTSSARSATTATTR